jgi:hypothetical protein
MSTTKSDERTTPSMTRAVVRGQLSEFSSVLASLETHASSSPLCRRPRYSTGCCSGTAFLRRALLWLVVSQQEEDMSTKATLGVAVTLST